MFERFTTAAREVVSRAATLAAGMGQRNIGTEHLLLAIMDTPQRPSTGAAVLAQFGIDSEAVRKAIMQRSAGPDAPFSDADAEALAKVGIDLAEVLARIDKLAGPPPAGSTPGRLRSRPLTPHAKKALQLSLREAIWLKSPAIGTEHLLLGLIRGEDAMAAQILAELGARPDRLRAAILVAIAEAA